MSKVDKELTIQALVEAVPYIGGSLATLYFGSKQKRQFHRIETFYKEIKEEVALIKNKIKDIGEHNSDELAAIIEQLHEKIEKEPLIEKREFFKNYFKNTLIQPVNRNYDERKKFLDILTDISLLEAEVIKFLNEQTGVVDSLSINKPGIEKSIIQGSIYKLKSWGIITATLGSIALGGSDGGIHESISLSEFGKRFLDFCLK
ncbi:MAG TPA: hypothetical protein VMW21_00520 [Patescibacteria group bacterium]|nr:hypothetical protein [Patescibacteria group bacterium]